jgi:hypothetical protein
MLQTLYLFISTFANHSIKVLLNSKFNKRYSNWQVLSVLVIYLFIVLTHILFLQQQHNQSSKSILPHCSIFKRKETAPQGETSLPQRLDKSVVDVKKITLKGVVSTLTFVFLFSIIFPRAFTKFSNLYLDFVKFNNNRKTLRLSLCMLRI